MGWPQLSIDTPHKPIDQSITNYQQPNNPKSNSATNQSNPTQPNQHPRHVTEVLEGGGARGGDVADARLGELGLEVLHRERRLGGLWLGHEALLPVVSGVRVCLGMV